MTILILLALLALVALAQGTLMVLYLHEFPRHENGTMDFMRFARKRTLPGRIFLLFLFLEAGIAVALASVLLLGFFFGKE